MSAMIRSLVSTHIKGPAAPRIIKMMPDIFTDSKAQWISYFRLKFLYEKSPRRITYKTKTAAISVAVVAPARIPTMMMKAQTMAGMAPTMDRPKSLMRKGTTYFGYFLFTLIRYAAIIGKSATNIPAANPAINMAPMEIP